MHSTSAEIRKLIRLTGPPITEIIYKNYETMNSILSIDMHAASWLDLTINGMHIYIVKFYNWFVVNLNAIIPRLLHLISDCDMLTAFS